jgi:toxin ParE1/3/4
VKRVRFMAAAEDEFSHEMQYFSALSPSLNIRFIDAVESAIRLASEFPGVGTIYKYGTRRVFPGDFKFSIVYLTRPDEVVVIAIAPFKRKPGYWRSRIKLA